MSGEEKKNEGTATIAANGRVDRGVGRLTALDEACYANEAAEKELEQLRANAARWDSYRAEMQDMERRMAKLAHNFLGLKAYEDAAKCALKAEGMRWVVGRMPPPNAALTGRGDGK